MDAVLYMRGRMCVVLVRFSFFGLRARTLYALIGLQARACMCAYVQSSSFVCIFVRAHVDGVLE